MSDTTGDVNEPLTTWWAQKSCDERSAALVIDDKPFLLTLFHFLSLSTTLSNNVNPSLANDTVTDINLNLCNSNEEFSTKEIEKVFIMSQSNCVNNQEVTLVPSSTDETKLDTKSMESQCSLSQQSSNSVISDQCGGREILNFNEPISTECNEGRTTTLFNGDANVAPTHLIQSVKVFETDAEDNAVMESSSKEANVIQNLTLNGFLNQLSFIFPSVISVSLEHGFRCPPFMSHRKHCSWPILIVHPSFISKFDTVLLPPPMFLNQSSSTWLAILGYHAERFDSRGNETCVPLSLVILSRLQASLLEAYRGSQCNLKSSAHFMLGESMDDQIIETALVTPSKGNLAEEKPSIFKLYSELKVIPVVLDTEVMPPLPLQDFPLLPFSYFRNYNESRFQEIDQVFKNLLLQAFSNSTETENSIACSELIEKVNDDEAHVSEQSLDSFVVQDSKTVTSKKKKKKKKKKRKVLTGEKGNGVSEAPVEQFISLDMSVSIESKEKAGAPTNLPSFSPVAEEIVLSEEPSLILLDESNIECANSYSEEIITSDIECDAKMNGETDIISPSSDVVESTVLQSSFDDNIYSVNDQTKLHALIDPDVDDGDVWETVESKSKNKNRGKNSDFKSRFGSGSSHHSNQGNWRLNSSSARKVKPARTMASRKRNATRKIVRDVLASVLDSVDTEIRERQQFRGSTRDERKCRSNCDPVNLGMENPDLRPIQTLQPVTLRDVVLGKHSRGTTAATPVQQRPSGIRSSPHSGIPRGTTTTISKSVNPEMRSKSTQTAVSGADQSTAPTILETLSGASANTLSSLATEEIENLRSREQATGAIIVVDDASSAAAGGEEVEFFQPKVDLDKEGNRSPPLETLLGPGNTNSASSSVASSLEAPHASKHRHHHNFSSNQNDVGYHLLDVCDRLSRDMNAFMARRAMALSTRRCERNAILVALQESVSKIWQNRGKVELYGSCATFLDLPSSDLDAVILGLTSSQDEISASYRHSSKKRQSRDLVIERNSRLDVKTQNHIPHAYGRLSPNGERVLRLAEELERQAWVVQVKAIPTATVPVVKILADPYKLHGLFDSVRKNWMIQQQHLLTSDTSSITPCDPLIPQGHTSFPPWRGADVMNGLFSIDITFDGPEHGGIGSTKFSADVVEKACAETGLPRENTPFVQVLMVLKELLAQRRLNEPFSGGLSSYALLLLVYAVVQERAIIREEIECIERHRELVASQDTAIANDKLKKQSIYSCKESGGGNSNIMNRSGERGITSEKQAFSNSSWASIAKKNSSQKVSAGGNTPISAKPSTQSFAEALSRNQKSTSQGTPSSKLSESGLDSYQTQISATSQVKKCNSRVSENEKPFRHRSHINVAPTVLKEKLQPQSHPNNATDSNLSNDSALNGLSSVFPQGSDDVLEVLCSGETTAGKLLLHFLLYYGQRFDSRGLAIDVAGNFSNYVELSTRGPSPYVPRPAGGVIDPITGMLTVDPIVIYDPWEGGRGSNVARSCYAWSSIQWHFAQCYMTLSSAVERCGTSSSNTTIASDMTQKNMISDHLYANPYQIRPASNNDIQDSANVGQTPPANIVSPLLELLISF